MSTLDFLKGISGPPRVRGIPLCAEEENVRQYVAGQITEGQFHASMGFLTIHNLKQYQPLGLVPMSETLKRYCALRMDRKGERDAVNHRKLGEWTEEARRTLYQNVRDLAVLQYAFQKTDGKAIQGRDRLLERMAEYQRRTVVPDELRIAHFVQEMDVRESMRRAQS